MKNTQTETSPAKNSVETIKLDSFEIKQAFKNTDRDGKLTGYLFNAIINGISFYQMRIRLNKQTNEWFISYPQRKGKDNAYYNQYFIPLTNEDADKIMAEVMARVE